jgi:hypothetical protein
VSVEAGLAELASATAWQRHRGDVPCVDCGVCAAAMWTQRVVIHAQVHEWQVCGRCLMRRMVEG